MMLIGFRFLSNIKVEEENTAGNTEGVTEEKNTGDEEDEWDEGSEGRDAEEGDDADVRMQINSTFV